MSIFRLLVFVCLSFALTLARADAASDVVDNVEGWVISVNYDDVGSCSGIASYQGGTSISILKIRPKGDWVMQFTNPSWTEITPSKTFDVVLRFDRRKIWNARMMGVESGFIFAPKASFVEDFARYSQLEIIINDKLIEPLSLKGTRAVTNALKGCYEKYVKRIDVFSRLKQERQFDQDVSQQSAYKSSELPLSENVSNKGFIFSGTRVTSKAFPNEYVEVGEELTLPMLKKRFPNFEVKFVGFDGVIEDCIDCIEVTGPTGTISFGYWKQLITGSIYSVDQYSEDIYGNKINSSLLNAVGKRAFCELTHPFYAYCESDKTDGLRYILANNNNDCLFEESFEYEEMAVPNCAQIGAFALYPSEESFNEPQNTEAEIGSYINDKSSNRSASDEVIGLEVESGESRVGWLGVQIQSVSDEIAESLGLGKARGALIDDVFRYGPAANADIRSGDIVLSFDGKDIETMRDLPKIVADTPANKEVDVVIFRKGKEETVKVVVGRLENGEKTINADAAKEEPANVLENGNLVLRMLLQELSDGLRVNQEINAEVNGVYIVEVEVGSNAADKGIKVGEVIVEANQESVSTPQDVADRVADLKKDGRKNAFLTISNKTGDSRFVVVRINE